MAKINPYLNFKGNTEEVFNFYKSVFGGEFAMVMRYGDVQGQEGCENLSDEDKDKIMHIALPLDDGHVLMACDVVISEYADKFVAGNGVSLSVSADSREDADKFFNGLAEDGKITMPLGDTFWGAYFGMLTDKFGIDWLINYDYPKN